jgi:hypothetical protein
MADVPFRECALARHEEASDARESLLTSLEELRTRADKFVAVVESTATVFTALAQSPARREEAVQRLRRLPDVSSDDAEERGLSEERGGKRPAFSANGNGASLYPDAEGAGTGHPQSLADDLCATKPGIPKAIVSANTARAVVGNALFFTMTTTGTPAPALTYKGDLPDHVRFSDNGDGTATLSGIPETAGEFRGTVRAKFDQRAAKYVAVQTFTLTVAAHDS